MKKIKFVSIILVLCMCFASVFSLTACGDKEEVKDAYTFTFNLNYEGGKNRVDTVKAGFRANYYSAKRTGYTLINWYSDKDCSGDPFNFSTPINKDYTVYAKWEAKGDDAQVTFNFNFTNCPNSVVITGEEGKVVGESNLPTYKRIGYDLVGWYTDSACTKEWNIETDKLTGDLDLYAKYDYNADLKFDENDKVILNNVEVDISVKMGAWEGKRGLREIVDKFNEEYEGQVHLNWVPAYTSETARIEDPGFTNQYTQNNYCMGDLLDLVRIKFNSEDFYPEAIQENYIGNSLLTYPVGHMVPSIVYNKEMMTALNGTNPLPANTTEFVNLLKAAELAGKDNDKYVASLSYEGSEWQWAEMAANNIWSANGLTYYSYDRTTGKYVNNFALATNKANAINAVKGFVNLFNNPDITVVEDSSWATNDITKIVEGNMFMGIIGYSRLYNGLTPAQLDKVGFLPLSDMFNNGDSENKKTFVKGVSVCLPNDTTATYDIEKLAGVALFCEYLSGNSAELAYNDTVPASIASQNSDDYQNGQSKYFKILRQLGDPSTFVTLPGHQYEYYFYNYQSKAYAQRLTSFDFDFIDNEAMLNEMVEFIADDISNLIR